MSNKIIEAQSSVIVEDDEELIDVNESEDDESEEEETETEETETESEEEDTSIPEKFRGKSLAEVVQSYENLEREFGRKSNEIGQLRKLTDQLLELERPKEEKKEEKKVIDSDSLLENPGEVINQVINDNPTLKKIEEQLVSRDREVAKKAFEDKHKDWKEVMGSPEFSEYVTKSQIRLQMLQKADQEYDYATADELLEDFKDYIHRSAPAPLEENSSKTNEESEKAKEEAGKSLASHSKSKSRVSSKKIYKRSQLIQMQIDNPAEYERRQEEFRKAYEEGRVR